MNLKLTVISFFLLAAGGVANTTQGQAPVCHIPNQTKAATKPARL